MRSVDKDADLGEAGKDRLSQPSPEEMFERFREVARKVVQIPKAVVVEREHEWKAAREEKKALRVAQGQTPKKQT